MLFKLLGKLAHNYKLLILNFNYFILFYFYCFDFHTKFYHGSFPFKKYIRIYIILYKSSLLDCYIPKCAFKLTYLIVPVIGLLHFYYICVHLTKS